MFRGACPAWQCIVLVLYALISFINQFPDQVGYVFHQVG